MDANLLPPLPGLVRISSSCSTSSVCTTSTMSSSGDTILSDEHVLNLDYQLSISESTSTGASKRRKRQTSGMIIKPTRWSPPLCHGQQTQTQQQQRHLSNDQDSASNACNGKSGTNNNITTTDTDFKPTFYNPNEVKHRRRISTHQCTVLEEEYHTNNKPSASKRHQLAEQLDMNPRTVQIWFQNKRAKAKQQQQQQQQQHKNKPAVSPSCHRATLPNSSLSSTAKSETSTSSLSTSTTATIPLDMFTFDDGRLDPIYLVDVHSVATRPPSASSPSASKCGTMLPLNEDDHDVAAVVAPMIDFNGISMIGDHGTIQSAPTPSAPAPAPTSAPISSPPCPSSETTGTCDAFTMWSNPNDTQHQQHPMPPHEMAPPFSSATTSSSTTPLQPFSSLDLFSVLQPYQQSHDTMDGVDGENYKNMINSSTDASVSNLYAISKQNDSRYHHNQQQQQQHCHDYFMDRSWTQKLPSDPGFGASMVSTWPYMMNQHAIQNDYLDFVLDQGDWMGPFYASP